jgi:hypothetical protein
MFMEREMRMWMTVLVAVVCLIAGVLADRLVIGVEAHAAEQGAPISIGGESVSIGMPRANALAMFSGKYGLIEDPNGGRVGITRSDTQAKPVRAIGALTFANGRVATATRYWGDYWDGIDNGIGPFWNALHDAIKQHVGAKRIVMEMQLFSDEPPGSHEEWISIRFPNRNIEFGKHNVLVDNRDTMNFYVRETAFSHSGR